MNWVLNKQKSWYKIGPAYAFKIFLKKNLLIQKSQTFVQNEGVWERNLQSSLRVEESLENRGSIDPGFCFFVNSTSGDGLSQKVFVP